MNDYLAAIVIGIVEGLTEFLPVSSTAHIRFTQELLGISTEDEYWKMFAVVIQLGAILAVVGYFWKRLWGFVGSLVSHSASRSPQTGSDSPVAQRPIWKHPLILVLLAFVVTAGPCFLIDKKIGENLENLPMMAWSLILGGVVMWLIDSYYSRRARTNAMEQVTWGQAIAIGLSQILAAAFPGTSRSMATIAGGQVVGLSRPAALEFSFFLSIPVMFAATLFKLAQFVLKEPVAVSTERWIVLAIGFITSLIVAWGVIAWFMHWVRQQGFAIFAVYRILVGGLVLYWTSRSA